MTARARAPRNTVWTYAWAVVGPGKGYMRDGVDENASPYMTRYSGVPAHLYATAAMARQAANKHEMTHRNMTPGMAKAFFRHGRLRIYRVVRVRVILRDASREPIGLVCPECRNGWWGLLAVGAITKHTMSNCSGRLIPLYGDEVPV